MRTLQRGQLMTLHDLPDYGRKKVRAVRCRSITEAMYWFSQGRVVTASGSYGAISVWRDKYGDYRGEFAVFRITRSNCVHQKLSSIKRWLKLVFPMLETPAPV